MTSIVLNSPINPEQLPEVLTQLVRTARRRAHIVINLTPLSPTAPDDHCSISMVYKNIIPNELTSPEATSCLRKLVDAHILDNNYQPIRLSRTQRAVLANELISGMSLDDKKWSLFEQLWQMKGLANSFQKALEQQQTSMFIHQIKSILRN